MPKDFVGSLLLDKKEITNILKDVNPNSIVESSGFFDRFGISGYVFGGNYAQALHLGRRVLELTQSIDNAMFMTMHKGAMYYWMGMSAYLLADFETAIYLMDAAVSEDVKNDPNNINTPARLFFRLQSDDPKQAAQRLTADAETQLIKLIDQYNKILHTYSLTFSYLNIDTLRNRILVPATLSKDPGFRSLASTLITFFIEFDYRHDLLMIRPELGTNEPFFFHLIKGCLLFESLLKKNPSFPVTKSTLGDTLKYKPIKTSLGLPDTFNIGTRDLKSVLNHVPNIDDNPASAILFTGTLRNALAHNLGWPDQLDRNSYIAGFFLIAISCLHAIGVLYKD